MKLDLDGVTLSSANGHNFRAFVIGWRLWRWLTWWRSKERGWVTVTDADGRSFVIRTVRT